MTKKNQKFNEIHKLVGRLDRVLVKTNFEAISLIHHQRGTTNSLKSFIPSFPSLWQLCSDQNL